MLARPASKYKRSVAFARDADPKNAALEAAYVAEARASVDEDVYGGIFSYEPAAFPGCLRCRIDVPDPV